MTIQDFKTAAKSEGQFYDNSEKAGSNWARTWGLTWWRDVWFYKEYRLGKLLYRTGQVRMRHGSHSCTECFIDGAEVSDNRFRRELAALPAPTLRLAVSPCRSSTANLATQLSFAF